MCGFAGYFSCSEKLNFSGFPNALFEALSHRGGDEVGYYKDNHFGCAHQRLAIRGLNESGIQPVVDEAGNVLVYNGEIYNTESIAKVLGISNDSKGNLSDTYLLFKYLVKYGFDNLNQVEGIFSFAFYEKETKRLTLVRDRLGIKPLFYSQDNKGKLFFCSEILPLLRIFNLGKKLDNQALVEYFWYGSPFLERTIFAQIKNVLPGEKITISKNGLDRSYWYSLEEDIGNLIEKQSIEDQNFKKIIAGAIARQTVSDVPVSIFVSSGIDSNIILHEASKVKSINITAYTAIFNHEAIDESHIAAYHAQKCSIDHESLNISIKDIDTTLRELVKVYGEPFGDAAAIPLNKMCSVLRADGKKVVLQGDGGDELFFGYFRYKVFSNIYFKFLSFISRFIPRKLLSHFNLSRVRRWHSILNSKTEAEKFALALTLHEIDDDPLKIFEADKHKELNLKQNAFAAFEATVSRFKNIKGLSKKMALTDMVLQLPSQFLSKVDRASMAANVEARVPFLDESILRSALPLNSRHSLKYFSGKAQLRRVYKKYLPKRIIKGKKRGFSTPYEKWIKEMLKQDKLDRLTDSTFCRTFRLSAPFIEELLKKKDKKHSDFFLIWKLYVFNIWYEEVYLE